MTVAAKPYSVWHPYTQMKTEPPPLKVKRAHGVHLELDDGRKIVDCISSWWVNVHGHCRPEIARAIYDQALNLEHVMFAGFTHEPAEKLSSRLISLLSSDFSRVFYSDNGSTAVEVALKMALQYWRNLGENERTMFIGFDGGYHGDTVGAMSLGGSAPFWTSYRPVMFQIETAPYPWTFESDERSLEKEEHSLRCLDEMLSKCGNRVAAVVIEPLVQGAGGMRMCTERFLKALEDLCRKHGVLVIYDEVMTGFGRTGDWFACKKAKTQPDMICMSKGIAGGFLPLAVTVSTERIYQAFLSDDPQRTLFHGHSFTANPISCAAGLASLDLLEENQLSFRRMELTHRMMSQRWLSRIDGIESLRYCGTIMAFEVATSGQHSYFNVIGKELRRRFVDAGILVRPLGNTVYLMPPYCIEDGDMEFVYRTMSGVLREVLGAAV